MELISVITLVLGSFLIASVLNKLINKTDSLSNTSSSELDVDEMIDEEILEPAVTKDEATEVQDL